MIGAGAVGALTQTKSGESHLGWHTGMHGQHGTYASVLYAASPRPSLASLRNWCSLAAEPPTASVSNTLGGSQVGVDRRMRRLRRRCRCV